ncbi:MAG: hypothetical protein RIE87_14080 [Rhodospirillales bacterium]|tara:strand:+ start:1621 stop:1845 length:225 start_codon:yes stop_codon:yes gene_type:complete
MKRNNGDQPVNDSDTPVERAYSDKGRQNIPEDYTAEDMRQGEILLKTKRSRYVIGGIIGCAFLAFAIAIYSLVP